MDVVRSCYTVNMRLQEGADPVVVQWHFAKKGAALIGVPTPFCSANWEIGDDLRFNSYLGEQAGPRPWNNGIGSAGLAGRRLCFPLSWFNSGVPAGEVINILTDRSDLPMCCQDTSGSTGGVIVNGRSDPPPPPLACALLLNSCVADDWGPQCPFIAGPTLPKTGTCTWSGSWATWSGTFNTRVSNNGADWRWEIDTAPMTVYTVPGDTNPPVHPVFNVPNLSATLWAAGVPCGAANLGFTIAYP
jgi:hypothetical protein